MTIIEFGPYKTAWSAWLSILWPYFWPFQGWVLGMRHFPGQKFTRVERLCSFVDQLWYVTRLNFVMPCSLDFWLFHSEMNRELHMYVVRNWCVKFQLWRTFHFGQYKRRQRTQTLCWPRDLRVFVFELRNKLLVWHLVAKSILQVGSFSPSIHQWWLISYTSKWSHGDIDLWIIDFKTLVTVSTNQ